LYKIILLPGAEKVYKKLFETNKSAFRRIDKALEDLKENPLQGKPLVVKLKGRYSLRIGVYRVIYQIEKKKSVVYILDIGHRRDIYR